MKHAKQKLSLVLLAALLLPILAACGAPQGGGQAQTSPSPAPESPVASPSPAPESPVASPSPAPESPVASPSPAPESPVATTGGKVLRIHQPQYPDVFDPQKSSFTNEIGILALVYEGLTKLNENLETVPAAAESWEFNDDATELTFTLREGLTYSDGSPLTSENFRYAIERTCDPATAGEYQSILFEIVGCEDWAGTLVTDTVAYEAGREALGLATDLGGYAIMLGGTSGAHLTSFSLVDILSHGRACALMNPYYAVFFAPAVEGPLRVVGSIARQLGYTQEDTDSLEGRRLGLAIARALIAFLEKVGLPSRLDEVPGFSQAHIERALKAAKDPQLKMKLENMPVPLTAEMGDDYMGPVLEAARTGNLELIRNV